MNHLWKTVRTGFWGGVVGLILIMPVVVYTNIFGDNISHDHKLWGEMGSAMAGIYGPILTILTFGVLVHQLRLQRQTNKHMFDQAYFQDTKADIEFYLMRLAETLDRPLYGTNTTRDLLLRSFENATLDELRGDELQQYAASLHDDVRNLSAIWSAIYGITASLGVANEPGYQSQHTSARLKAVAMLSYATCVALDNYLFCRAPDEHRAYPFYFSRNLQQS